VIYCPTFGGSERLSTIKKKTKDKDVMIPNTKSWKTRIE
jgi:hypothetical protein